MDMALRMRAPVLHTWATQLVSCAGLPDIFASPGIWPLWNPTSTGCWEALVGAGEEPNPLSGPVAWAERRMWGSLCSQHVLSCLCSKGGQAQPRAQALPPNLSDGGDEQ